MRFHRFVAACTIVAQISTAAFAQTTPAQMTPAQTTPAPATTTTAIPTPAVAIPPSPTPAPPAEPGKQPSLHVRCDGRPPQMSDGESFARILGAVTLLGIFAPRPEMADATKRLTGEAGIAACSELIDGPHRDGNGLRRLQLILARAIHHMETKDYKAALADVDKARAESKDLNLLGNPYFDQSFGLSFDLLGAQATYLLGDAAGAREIGLRTASHSQFGFFPMITAVMFSHALRTASPAEDAALEARDRIAKYGVQSHAMRLDDQGRFAEAGKLREALIALFANFNSESPLAWLRSNAALDWAMAGDWARAEDLATTARASIDKGDTEGKPDPSRAVVIEVLDFHAVLKAAHEGKIDEARRLFSGRSEWTAPTFGVVAATTTMLRKGAKPEQLIGPLAKTEDDMWKAREDKSKAQFLQNISEGKIEWGNIMPFAKIDEYEKTSGRVWKGERSGVLGDKPEKNSKFYKLNPVRLEPIYRVVAPDSLLLDAAVIAKARGFKGFVYFGSQAIWADRFVEFGNPGDPDMIEPFYLDADAVIADLRQLIPSPEDLAARQKAVKS